MNKNVVQPTLVQQEKFIQRTIECSLNGLLHYAATAKSTRRNVYSTLMKRLNCFGGENSASREFRINFSKVAVNEQKRKKYLELTVDLIKRRNDESGAFELKEWALVLMQNIDHNIWRIVYSQIKRVNEGLINGPREMLVKNMLISSLLALQG